MKIWKSDTDWFAADTHEEATRLRNKLYGWSEDLEPFDLEPLADDKELSVTFQEGHYEDLKEYPYPRWVDSEPQAKVSWEDWPPLPLVPGQTAGSSPDDDDDDPDSPRRIARVSAPAAIWAKHMNGGLVGSTEF